MNRFLFVLAVCVIPLTVFAQLSNQSYKEKFLNGQLHEAIQLAEIRRPYLKSGEVPFHPVVIYFENFPSAEQMIAMRDLGAVLYADTWTPPVGRHPFGFMVASVPVERLKDMAGLGFVQKLGSAAKTSKALNNTAAESIMAPLVWAKGFKGSGKKICILDSGIDISYQGTDLPATFQYKDYSYFPLLDDDVANTTTGHGTHVAATVLGRGVLSAGHKHWNNGNGPFQGIAPEADMVFLKIGQDEDAMAEDAMTIAAIDAAVNIYNADIITMSYGGWDDFHDGSSALEQKVDWAYSMGVPFFCSAGNAADDDKHWMGTVPAHGASGFIELEVTEPNGDTLMLRFNTVWADGVKRNNISIQYFDATKQPLGNIITFPATESPRGTESMYSYFGNALTAGGTYYLKIINNSDDNQVVHIFEDWNNLRIGTDHVYFTESEKSYTIGSPSSADHAFSVGAYVSKTGWTSSQNSNRWWGPDYVTNNIALFSSFGPTLDNRVKPDLCAPGHVLISLRDKDVYTNLSHSWVDNDGIAGGDAEYYSMRGTSMACPVTAGAAALFLQKFPDALPQQVYDAMKNYSNKTGLPNLPDNTWGYGKLDIDAAIRHFRNPIEIDGNIAEENYKVLASFTSTRNGFGNQNNIGALKFSSDGENMYVGVTGELTSNNNILVFIDFSGVQGRGNNTLGGGNSGDFVYCAFAYMNNVKMDFDVDFALGFNKGNSSVEFFTDAIRYGIQNTAANLGKTNQTGACSNFDLASVFGGTGYLSVAFDSTYPANPQSGVEFKIPYSAFAGADTSQTVRFFVVISAQEGNVSNECIPGDPGATNLGDGVDFSVIPGQDFFTQPIKISVPKPTTFVLSNEGGLIDDLIRAGHGTKNLYQTLQILKPKSGGVISDDFMAVLANCPAGSEIFTAALNNFGGLNNPVCVNSDGTMSLQAIFARDYLSKYGYTTTPLIQNGYTPELFMYANSPEHYINAGASSGQSHYKAFAIAWKSSTTFVLSNEGGLIDDLIRDGHGSKNLYQTLEILKPKSGGVISDDFITALANCPAGSEIFTAALSNFGGLNNPVCVNTDGTSGIRPIFGKDYYGNEGYVTYPDIQTGVDKELFTYATNSELYIDAGASGANPDLYRYKAFAIAWSEPDTLTISAQTLEVESTQGSTAAFSISSNSAWSVVSNQVWLSASPTTGSGNADIILTAQANAATAERIAIVTITTQGGKTGQVTITQKGSISFFTVSPVTLTIGSAAQSTASFKVTANVAWAASSNQSWVGIAPESGDTTKTVVLTVKANPLITSRKAIVSITAAGYQTVNVTVTQQAGTPVLQVSPDAVSIAAAGTSTQKITVTSNTNWTAGSTETWLTVTPISGKNNGSVTLQAGTNPLVTTRTAQIQFAANGTPGKTVAVTQQTGSAYLSVSPDTLTLQAANESADTIFVSSNAQWLASADQLWLTIAPSSGTGNDTVLVTAQANSHITPRNASVTFSVSGIGNKNVHVKQNGAAPFLFVQNDTLKIAPSGTLGLNIPVQSNINWSITEAQSWLDVSPAGGFGNDTIVLTVAENRLPVPRSVTLYFKGNGLDSVPIYIEQMAADVQLQVLPAQVQIDAAQGSKAILTINSNTAWQVVSNQSWLAADVGSGNGNDTLDVTATENTTLTERIATLTFTAEGAAPKTVLVTQQPGKATLFVNVNALNIDAGQGSQVSFSITSNTTWAVTPEQNWITANPGSGTGNLMVVLTALGNPLITQRTATVQVSATGATPVSVTITQAAGNATLAVNSDTLKIGEQGGSTVSFIVTSNTNWVVTSGQAWLTANPSAGNGNATVTLTAQANPSTAMRQSTVTVSAAVTGAKSIIVKQPGLNTPLTQELNVTDELTCFPNPFDGQTTIRFSLKESGKIKLSLFDNTGKEVTILFEGNHSSGVFDLNINANDHHIPSGFCFCVLKTDTLVITRKMMNTD